MNNYDLSQIDAENPKSGRVSPYISYGTGQVLRINKIELKKSQNTGSYKAILHMETRPINDESFTPVDGAKGKVGKVASGVYLSNEELKRQFFQKMKTIAFALGVENEVNKIKSSTFEEVVEKLESALKGKYARYTITASEYPKPDGKIGITLNLPKFNFVESEDTNPSRIVQFDKSNKYHYKEIPKGATSESEYSSGYGPQGFEAKSDNEKSTFVDEPDDMPF